MYYIYKKENNFLKINLIQNNTMITQKKLSQKGLLKDCLNEIEFDYLNEVFYPMFDTCDKIAIEFENFNYKTYQFNNKEEFEKSLKNFKQCIIDEIPFSDNNDIINNCLYNFNYQWNRNGKHIQESFKIDLLNNYCLKEFFDTYKSENDEYPKWFEIYITSPYLNIFKNIHPEFQKETILKILTFKQKLIELKKKNNVYTPKICKRVGVENINDLIYHFDKFVDNALKYVTNKLTPVAKTKFINTYKDLSNELRKKVQQDSFEIQQKEGCVKSVQERWKYNTYNVEDREADAKTIFDATKHLLFNLKNEYINQSLANFYESLLTFKYGTFYKERKNDWSKKYNFSKSILYFSSELKGGCGKTFLADVIMDYFIELGVAKESDKKLKLYSEFNFKKMGFNNRTLSTSDFVLFDDEDDTFINNKKFKSIRKSIAEKEYVTYCGKDYKKYDDGKTMKVNANVIVTGNEIQNSFVNANSRDIHEVKFSTDKYKIISKDMDFIHFGMCEEDCKKIMKESLETIFKLLTPETFKTILKKLSVSETNDTTEHIINLYTKIFNTGIKIGNSKKDLSNLHPIFYAHFIESIDIFNENGNLTFNENYQKFCTSIQDRDASNVYESGKVYFSKIEYRDAILEMRKLGFVEIVGSGKNGKVYSKKSKNFLLNKLKFNVNKFINNGDDVLEYDVEKNMRDYYKFETGVEKVIVYDDDKPRVLLIPVTKRKVDIDKIKGVIDDLENDVDVDAIANDFKNVSNDVEHGSECDVKGDIDYNKYFKTVLEELEKLKDFSTVENDVKNILKTVYSKPYMSFGKCKKLFKYLLDNLEDDPLKYSIIEKEEKDF